MSGYNAGMVADEPISAFEMSPRVADYQIGYVMGHAFSESVRLASSHAGCVVAIDLAKTYGIPTSCLREYFDDPEIDDVEDEEFDDFDCIPEE
ncbi:hypothetical protein AC233_11330 [Burkholderia sp. HB1]|nr:hypothetical protein AC233_11330 [Burkholderia sp. HB1]